MSSAGDYSKLSVTTCESVMRWARDSVPLPKCAEDEIRALAKSVGAEDPIALIGKDEREMHAHRAMNIVRRLNEGSAKVKDLGLRTEIWQWRLADRRHQMKEG